MQIVNQIFVLLFKARERKYSLNEALSGSQRIVFHS